MTDSERLLWGQLRGRRLQGWKFKRQWTLGPFVVDFCCWEARLVVEVDGGQHSVEKDARRTAWLENQGYRILRFWNHEILGNLDGVLQAIQVALASDPHPNQYQVNIAPRCSDCAGGTIDPILPQAGEGA